MGDFLHIHVGAPSVLRVPSNRISVPITGPVCSAFLPSGQHASRPLHALSKMCSLQMMKNWDQQRIEEMEMARLQQARIAWPKKSYAMFQETDEIDELGFKFRQPVRKNISDEKDSFPAAKRPTLLEKE